MKRPICHYCQLPSQHCVCAEVKASASQTQLLVIQDRREQKHAKNTVGLLQLNVPNCQVWLADQNGIVEHWQHKLDTLSLTVADVWLLYPSPQAIMLERQQAAPKALLLLDGTWKQTYRLLQMNPWLTTLPTLSFEVSENQYAVRDPGKIKNSCSTLEAAARCLAHFERYDTQPLLNTLAKRVASLSKPN